MVLILSFLITSFFISQKQKSLKVEIEHHKKIYVEENKERIKRLVNRIENLIRIEKEDALEDLKKHLKDEVYAAHKIATSLYEKAIKKHSKEEAFNVIKTALSNISFNSNRAYIVISDNKGEILLHRYKNLEGLNFYNYKDSKGYQFVKTITDVIKNKTEQFDTYSWYKNLNENVAYKKIGFNKYFEPYDVAISAADYIVDFEKEVQKRVLDKLNSLEFSKDEHIFIYTLDGLCLVNPKKHLIGKNRYNAKNKKGEYALQKSLNFVKENKEGFRNYNATVKLNEKLTSNSKISYLKLYDGWDWMIGSGFYLEGLYNQILEKEKALITSNKKAMEQIIVISIILTLFLIFISFYISQLLKRIFDNYKLEIKAEVENSLKKEKLLVQQSKMATMGEMLASIAHQWKQPLSLISMSNALIRLNRESQDFVTEKDVNEAVDNIDNSVKNLNQTIEDFRNFFNPNKLRKKFNIVDIIDDTFKLISSQFRNNNIEVIKKIESIELFGSENELLQTLINILKNAKEELIKKDSSQKRLIFIETKKNENELIIKIKDNAGGISENIIEKIFDAYFTTKEKNGGTGIGLYMSKQIIEGSMKGKIEVFNTEFEHEDIEYKGCEFTISLPLDFREKER